MEKWDSTTIDTQTRGIHRDNSKRFHDLAQLSTCSAAQLEEAKSIEEWSRSVMQDRVTQTTAAWHFPSKSGGRGAIGAAGRGGGGGALRPRHQASNSQGAFGYKAGGSQELRESDVSKATPVSPISAAMSNRFGKFRAFKRSLGETDDHIHWRAGSFSFPSKDQGNPSANQRWESSPSGR